MAKYRVITVAVAVKNNRIAKFDEIVDDSELTVNANALILSKSLELVEEKESKSKSQQIPASEETAAEKVAEVEVTEEKVGSKKAKTAAEKVAEKNK